MTATLAAIPTHALLCWVDDRNVYISIPTKSGLPFIERFPLHEAGLSKALNYLRIRYDELPSHEKNYTVPPVPVTVGRGGKPPVQTEAQRDAALALLRKMGVV
jgi:hypothetical protein